MVGNIFMTKKNKSEVCPDCHGAGTVDNNTCSSCNGKGIIGI